jgi:hypothetical protein
MRLIIHSLLTSSSIRLRPLAFALCAIMILLSTLPRNALSAEPTQTAATNRVFLPLAASKYRNGPPLLLGNYPSEYLGTQEAIDNSLIALDSWAGKGLSIAGTFLDFDDPNPDYNVYYPMERLWNNGYTAFVNLITQRSAADIAQGREDTNIHEIAAAFANWMALARDKQQERFVFLAPLPEANITNGNTYGGDPVAYQAAYRRIQDIFASEFSARDLPTRNLKWVFAPNGYEEPGRPSFEAYYPGHDRVDVVGFSSYNWGYCVHWEYDRWEMAEDLYLPYVQRMWALAPGKPIFITQTASTAEYPSPNQFNAAKKDEWFIENYSYIASLEDVRAILYYNIDGPCDWTFFQNGSIAYNGYRVAVSDPAYTYLTPNEMISAFSAE